MYAFIYSLSAFVRNIFKGIYTAPRYATSQGYSQNVAPVAICEIIRNDVSRNFISVENGFVIVGVLEVDLCT